VGSLVKKAGPDSNLPHRGSGVGRFWCVALSVPWSAPGGGFRNELEPCRGRLSNVWRVEVVLIAWDLEPAALRQIYVIQILDGYSTYNPEGLPRRFRWRGNRDCRRLPALDCGQKHAINRQSNNRLLDVMTGNDGN
jgi:hypothetical protein